MRSVKRGDRRGTIRKKLDPNYVPYFDALCSLLDEHWQPYSGLRTMEQQEFLYKKGRDVPGNIVTNAKPGESAHNFGCATDWTIFDDDDKPIFVDKSDPCWVQYREACAKAGLTWGGEFLSFPDYYHNELPLDCSWQDVKKVYDEGDSKKTDEFIKIHLRSKSNA